MIPEFWQQQAKNNPKWFLEKYGHFSTMVEFLANSIIAVFLENIPRK